MAAQRQALGRTAGAGAPAVKGRGDRADLRAPPMRGQRPPHEPRGDGVGVHAHDVETVAALTCRGAGSAGRDHADGTAGRRQRAGRALHPGVVAERVVWLVDPAALGEGPGAYQSVGS